MFADPLAITVLLRCWRGGDTNALNELLPQVQRELRQSARRMMSREAANATLQPTALVNELYLRLATGRRRRLTGKTGRTSWVSAHG